MAQRSWGQQTNNEPHARVCWAELRSARGKQSRAANEYLVCQLQSLCHSIPRSYQPTRDQLQYITLSHSLLIMTGQLCFAYKIVTSGRWLNAWRRLRGRLQCRRWGLRDVRVRRLWRVLAGAGWTLRLSVRSAGARWTLGGERHYFARLRPLALEHLAVELVEVQFAYAWGCFLRGERYKAEAAVPAGHAVLEQFARLHLLGTYTYEFK